MKGNIMSILVLALFAASLGTVGAHPHPNPATAVEPPDIPNPVGYVNDWAGMLSHEVVDELNAYLASVDSATSVQIAFLSLPRLNGEDIAGYSIRVAERWGLGTAEEDNGVLLVVALEERQIRIEVGYGLEGVLTDATSGYIIREIIAPEFARGNTNEGISEGIRTIVGIATGNVSIDPARTQQSEQQESARGIPFFFIAFILFSLMGSLGRYRRGGLFRGLVIGSMLGGMGRRSGGFGGVGRSGSSGFGGGFSSGGFGGFSGGGGGFGGGGASGGW